MTDQYLQFGAPDYGGFTTEEEIARRMSMMSGTRGSPAIGARVEAKRAHARAQEYASARTGTGASASAGASAPVSAPQLRESEPIQTRDQERVPATHSVVSALKELCASRPVSLLDWIVIFIIIIALVCLFESAPDVISRVFRGSAIDRAHGGYCAECGGVIN